MVNARPAASPLVPSQTAPEAFAGEVSGPSLGTTGLSGVSEAQHNSDGQR